MCQPLGRALCVRLLRALALLCWGGWGLVASAQSVVFINPGKSNEAYWVAVTQVMQQAARSLGMQLEVIYAERNRLLPVELVKEVAQRPARTKPQYLVLTNDYSTAPEMLRTLEGAGIPVFMAFSGVQGDLRGQTGRPRERYPFWLGSLEPRGEDAGYLTARALIDKARTQSQLRGADGKWHFMAVAGDRSTTVSVARNNGMRRAVQEAPDVVFTQEVYGEWRRDRAQEQAKVLYKRYPDAKLVWAGSDQMAFGAMEAWRQQGGTPGKDALFSGINTSQEALDARKRGELTALAGGHFMAGAWALVMLYDHSKGIDFAPSEGLELEYPMFMLLDESNIPAFEARFVQVQTRVDFKTFSKFHNPKIKKYDFDIGRLLR
ncbi:MAG: ABC transporter substrate-binding protein [Comamonas sp.]